MNKSKKLTRIARLTAEKRTGSKTEINISYTKKSTSNTDINNAINDIRKQAYYFLRSLGYSNKHITQHE